MIVGIPVLGEQPITDKCLDYLMPTISKGTQVVLVENKADWNSVKTYEGVYTIQNKFNYGYYYPLKQLHSMFPDEILCLMHNDVFVYEVGWDVRLAEAFSSDNSLALVGFCGSNEADVLGGRGSGTMCNFRGEQGQLQEHTGRKIHGLMPSLILDSLFMAFRRSVVSVLDINSTVPLAHFMDRIWPTMLIEAGYRVATLGVEIDHIGGTTITKTEYEEDAKEWCAQQKLPIIDTGDRTMYLEMERRWLSEFRDEKKLIPASIDARWNIKRDS